MRSWGARSTACIMVAVLLASHTLLAVPPVAIAADPVTPSAGGVPEAPTESLKPITPTEITLSAEAIELVDRRSAHSRVYDNRNGTYVLQSSLERLHYLDTGTQQYVPIDPTLELVNDGSKDVFRNKADSYTLTLPPVSGEGEWVTAATAAGTLKYRPASSQGDKRALPSVSRGAQNSAQRGRVTYAEAFGPAIDIEYHSYSGGLKETIVLSRYTGVTTFGFDLSVEGLIPELMDNGAIYFTSVETSAAAFIMPAPWMEDTPKATGDEPIRSDAVHYELTPSDTGWRLDVVADEAWLADPARAYPVRIDPTTDYIAEGYGASMDCFITDAYPNANYGASWDSTLDFYQLKSGYYPGAGNNRTLIMPDVTDLMTYAATDHVQILGANMNLACRWRYDHGSGPVWYGPITGEWGEYETTWNNQPTFDDYSLAYIAEGGRTRFEVTSLVQAWMDGTPGNPLWAGFEFWGRGNTVSDWTKLYASENEDPAPVFECWFTTTPKTPVVSYLASSVSTTPTISWTYDDEMGKIQKRANIELRPVGSGTTWTSTQAGAEQAASLPTPDGGWVNGSSYEVRVQTIGDIDGWGEAPSAWSGWTAFNYRPITPEADIASTSEWFQESDSDGDGVNDARNDANVSGRGSVTLTWLAMGGATSYNVYLFDGNTFRSVGSTAGTSWSTAGKGLYPTDTAIASLLDGSQSNPYLSGTGLDLRDDPRPLYAKTAGISMDGLTGYAFKVVPVSQYGEAPLANVPTVNVTLDNRTIHLVEDPRHVAYDAGDVLGHDGEIYLERGSLELQATDLALDSYGPDASLTRHYTSSSTNATTFAPGWRFPFEQSLVISGDTATYTDADGDAHVFTQLAPQYSATGGYTYTSGTNTVHVFNSSGTLVVNGTIPQAQVLVVGGGGGGFCNMGGGGGGGGVVQAGGQTLAGSMPVIVGLGGGSYYSTNGGDSVFNSITAYGGGRGASRDFAWYASWGGSGGGGAGAIANENRAAGGAYQGGAGGVGTVDWGIYSGGAGGGGAAATGGNGAYACGGIGGAGTWSTVTGTFTYYGGGGGGASYFTPGYGGIGGGGQGQGGNGSGGWGSTPGAPNTGGGGGAGSEGGSGIVAVSYPTPQTVWAAPNGFTAALITSRDGHTLRLADDTVLAFDTQGRLTSITDAEGDRVTYDRSVANRITITAANSQQIVVNMTAAGKVTGAAYVVGTSIRSVAYCDGNGYVDGTTASVTHFPGSIDDEYRHEYTYGSSGSTVSRLVSLSLPAFQPSLCPTWVFGYDQDSRLQSWQLTNTAQSFGAQSVTYYGLTAAVTTPHGIDQSATASYQWNRTGTLISRTTKSGMTPSGEWRYAYDPRNECAFETTPIEHRVRRVYDSRGNLAIETADAVSTTTWTYDTRNRTTTSTDAGGSTTTYTYPTGSASRNPTREDKVLAPGVVASTQYAYGSHGLLTSKTEAISGSANVVTTYSNHALNGEPQTTTVQGVALEVDTNNNPTNMNTVVTNREYDGFGNLLWEKDAEGKWVVQQNTYSTSGRLMTSQSPAGATTEYTYNPLGGVTSSSTSDGTETINHYSQELDPFGTVLLKTSYDGGGSSVLAIERSTTDSAGHVVSTEQLAPDGTALSFSASEYNAEGWETDSWSALAPGTDLELTPAAETGYDAVGNVTSVKDPGATKGTTTKYYPSGMTETVIGADDTSTTYIYDAMNRQVAEIETTTSGSTTKLSTYDMGGRMVCSADETGDETTYTYDLLGRQLTAGLEGEVTTTNVYNNLGWLLSETDADNIRTATKYDKSGKTLTSSVTAPNQLAKTTTTEYDGCSRVSSTTDPDMQEVRYEYDAFSRVWTETQTNKQVTPSAVIKVTTTTYDSLSRVESTTKTVGADVIESTYEYRGSMPATSTVSYGGTTTTIQMNAGTATEAARTVTASGISPLVRTMGYDESKRETSATLPALDFTSTRGFDSGGRIRTQSGTGFVGETTYDYRDSDKKQAESIPLAWGGSIETTSFGYSADSRLTTAGVDTYAYDYAGNLTRYTRDGTAWIMTYSTGQLASLKPEGGQVVTNFAYDTLGRRTAQGPEPTPVSTKYTYNEASRLATYESGGVHAKYTYDGYGQRLTSSVVGSTNTTDTAYSYDGLTLLSLSGTRTDGESWDIAYFYTADGRPYAGLYTEGTASIPFSMLTTDRGDVVELLDSSGESFAAYRYDAWGRVLSTSSRGTAAITAEDAAAITDRQVLRYAGYAYDAESKLYYCSARYYDPATMQFLTKDIAKADAEESPYQYCSGNPVGKVDPSGLVMEAYSKSPATRLKGRIRAIARKYADAVIPYKMGGKTWAQIDCSGFVLKVLQEAGLQPLLTLDPNYTNSTMLIGLAGRQGSPTTKYFDSGRSVRYQVGDVLYKSGSPTGHVVLVISDGVNPEIAESTPYSSSDGTRRLRLSQRMATWKPERSGRYFYVYSRNIPR